MFSSSVNYTYVKDIVVGRVLFDNCLMRIMHFMNGELVSLNGAVIGAHQGFDGFKAHIQEKKAGWSDISWNQNVTKFKYINHQGTLRNANRVACMIHVFFLCSGLWKNGSFSYEETQGIVELLNCLFHLIISFLSNWREVISVYVHITS